jgi:thiol-disulfide isomerase/thioredoxin
MTLWKAAALAVALALGAPIPALLPAACAQDGGGGDMTPEDAQAMQAQREKALKQLESKDWDGALATYGDLEKKVQAAKIDASVKNDLLGEIHYNCACAYSLKGEKPKALEQFEKSLKDGYADFDHMAEDTDLDNIRNEPKYKELVETYKAKASQAESDADAKKLAAFNGFTLTNAEGNKPLDGADGKPVSLADYKGQVVLIDIWGTWCPPCREEIPHLIEMHKKLNEKGFSVLGLNWERASAKDAAESGKKAKDFLAKAGATYRDAGIDTPWLEKWGIEAFPTLLVLDKSGKVRKMHVGYTEQDVLEGEIAALMAEAGPAMAPKAPEPPATPSGDGAKPKKGSEDF